MKKLFSTPLFLVIFYCFFACKQNSIKLNEQDILATNILKSLNIDAYNNTDVIEWTFSGKRYYNFNGDVSYKWYKKKSIVEVMHDSTKVILNLKDKGASKVFIAKKQLKDFSKVQVAQDLFNNDSFWLVAPYKLFEDGVYRSIVAKNKEKGLLVKYTKGGTTPGDSYLWFLDKDYLPVKFLMTVPSMQLKNEFATWTDWKKTSSGILLPQKHLFKDGSVLHMKNIRAYIL